GGSVGRSRGVLFSGAAGDTGGSADRAAIRVTLESALGTIARALPHSILLAGIRYDFHVDLAETFVRIVLRIIRHRVRVAQVFADRLERFHLLLPRLRPIGFAAGAGG